MKKYIFGGIVLGALCISTAFANSPTPPTFDNPVMAANFLASKGVIENHEDNPGNYNVYSYISRREMLKVMMHLSGLAVNDRCEGMFADLPPSDWGCKYAEAAANAGLIAKNEYFRPNDNVTQIEALKMIMQARNISKEMDNADWREAYSAAAVQDGLIDEQITNYNAFAERGWIFSISARTFRDMNQVVEPY